MAQPASRAAGSSAKKKPATKDLLRLRKDVTPPLYSVELRAATRVGLYDGQRRLRSEVGEQHLAYTAVDEPLGRFPDLWAAFAAIRQTRDGGGR